MKLLPSQKKQLFETIEKYDASLLPRFAWGVRISEYTPNTVEALRVRDTEYFFAFDDDRYTRLNAVFSPGTEAFIEKFGPLAWIDAVGLFIPWMDNLRREFSAGDPWGDLAKALTQSDLKLEVNVEATKFTYSEYSQVVKTLDVIKGLMCSYAKSDASSLARIEKEISSLKEVAKEQDRKSVFYLVVGFIASTAVSMALAPEQTRALYEALKAGFAKFVVLLGS